MTSQEYKANTKIPDLYDILGLSMDVVKQTDCEEQIKKAYSKKAKLCHPDKHPGRKDMQELFLLLTEAYNILIDSKLREEYNHKLSLNKQSSGDFFRLKDQSKKYIDSIGEFKPATDQQKLAFKDQMKMLDVKHGYDASLEGTIGKKEAKKRMVSLDKERALQYEMLKQDRIFDENEPFSLEKFNEAFDQMHKRDDTALMSHNGVPSAWNDMGAVANYSSFDDLNNLYVDNGNHFGIDKQTHSSINIGSTPTTKLTREQVAKLKGASYVKGHSDISDDYYQDMKAKLAARKSEAGSFDNMKYADFKRDDDAGYGIFSQLGFKIDDKLTFDDEEDIASKYERLRMERDMDVNVASAGGNKRPAAPGRR
jgi:curved DNA-binding protein CbpA